MPDIVRSITSPVAVPVWEPRVGAGASGSSGLAAFPDPEAVVDLDFMNQRYWWNGALRTTAEFTTYALNGSTFGAEGLTPSSTIDITINVSAFWSIPGAYAARLFSTSNPAGGKHVLTLSDGTDNNRINIFQNTASAQLRCDCVVGGAGQASAVAVNGTLSVATGFAASFAVNDIRAYRDGTGATPDTLCTMPAATILRIGKAVTAATEYAGAIGRFVLYDSVQVNAWLLAKSNEAKVLVQLWTPLALGAALKGWWNADDTVDGAVSTWTTRDGSALAVTAGSPNQPTSAVSGGYRYVTFDGVDDYLRGSAATLGLPTGATIGEIWALASDDQTASGNLTMVAYGSAIAGGTQNRQMRRSNAISSYLQLFQVLAHTDTVTPSSGLHIWGGLFSTSLNAGRIDGQATTPASTATGGSLSTATASTTIGANNAATAALFWKGKIRHLIVTTELVLADQQKLEGYLAWDVGMASLLPAGHPYKSARP